MLTSSSHRETTPENRRNPPTGCISGLLRLLSRRRPRKRLTSARKKEKIAGSETAAIPSPALEKKDDENNKEWKHTSPTETKPSELAPIAEIRRQCCDTPRSPTIPPEIRKSPADSPRRATAAVARLMGLDETSPESTESAAEKRRKLLGALEKCDEDLKALKRIIEAVKSMEIRRGGKITVGWEMCRELDGGYLRRGRRDGDEEHRSPVSVLEVISSPGFRANGFKKDAEDQTRKKKDMITNSHLFFRRMAIEGLPRLKTKQHFIAPIKRRPPAMRSEAMAESVDEVWEDGVWAERWELGRIEVGLEIDIFADLVEEVVRELVGCCYRLSLPLRACRKRLCF